MSLAKAGFVLGIKPVSILRPHEQTIPEHVEELVSEMRRDGVQKDPIMIDVESATVLDGMHRLAACEALRIENAVCCSVDYSSRAVSLGRWARVYTVPTGGSAAELLGRFGITRRVTLAEAFDALDNKDTGLAALTSDAAYLPGQRLGLGPAFEIIEELDGYAESKKWDRRFVSEDDVDVPLQSSRSLVVLVRRLGKDDVVSSARSGKLFPCKTSMHRIDPRPVAVDFPLGELNRATSASLREALSGRTERLLPADSMYEGRRYKERLLLLNQE